MFTAQIFNVSRRLTLWAISLLVASTASAATIPVLNGNFETLYKGNSTTITEIPTANSVNGPSGFFTIASGGSSNFTAISPNANKGNGAGVVNWSDGSFTLNSASSQTVTLPGWQGTSSEGTQVANGISAPGTMSVFIQGPGFGGPGAGTTTLMTSTVGATQVVANTYYQLSVDAAAVNGTVGGAILLGLAYATTNNSTSPTPLATSGAGINTSFTEGTTLPGASWGTYTITYTPAYLASQGIIGDYLYPQFGMKTVNGQQDQFDNVQLATIPEPSTWVLSLSGATGLVLLAGRRKRSAS